MRFPYLLIGVAFSIAACGSNVTGETGSDTSTSTGTGSGSSSSSTSSSTSTGCDTDGTDMPSRPLTTTTPGCPAAINPQPYSPTCTQAGQACTWTTGEDTVTYTCQMVDSCFPPEHVLTWIKTAQTGNGCTESRCCVPCANAKLKDPCDVLGYQCPYQDASGGYPPVIGLTCVDHVWTSIYECEN